MRRTWLISLAVLAGTSLATMLSAAERPNVVIILIDDLGWGSVGCYGADPEQTQLAQPAECAVWPPEGKDRENAEVECAQARG